MAAKEQRRARKSRKEHTRQQRRLQAQNQPTCPGCVICTQIQAIAGKITAAEAREVKEAKRVFFRGDVTINSRDAAAFIASQDVGHRQNRLVYWTDGCSMKSGSGIGIVTASFGSETWVEGSWRTKERLDANVMEILAITKALELAMEQCKDRGSSCVEHVVVYSDSINALNLFQRNWKDPRTAGKLAPLEEAISAAAELDALGVRVELRWVPAHEGVGGNPRADKAARNAARQGARKVPQPFRRRGGTTLIECFMRKKKNIDIFRN